MLTRMHHRDYIVGGDDRSASVFGPRDGDFGMYRPSSTAGWDALMAPGERDDVEPPWRMDESTITNGAGRGYCVGWGFPPHVRAIWSLHLPGLGAGRASVDREHYVWIDSDGRTHEDVVRLSLDVQRRHHASTRRGVLRLVRSG